jgi:hypothetical protein
MRLGHRQVAAHHLLVPKSGPILPEAVFDDGRYQAALQARRIDGRDAGIAPTP